MSNIICKQCGLEGFSKCPHCRSVFSESSVEAVYSHYVVIEPGKWIGWRSIPRERTPYETFVHFRKCLNSMSEEEIKNLFCLHKWEFKPGEHSTIGCGH